MSARGYAWRRRCLLAGVLVAALLLLGRAAQLQLFQADRWAARAEKQQRHRLTLPAPRGTIYDRDGVPLAASREVYRVAVAPPELKDRRAAAVRLRAVLGLTGAEAQRVVDRRRRWVVLPEVYDAGVRERLNGIAGIYFERVLERFHPRAELALGLLGRVSAGGHARSGLELELDSVLAGSSGLAVVRRDARGEPIPGGMLVVREAVPGNDVYLTIDVALQEIAEAALEQAVEETGAAGGDVVIADPSTGELLAAAGMRTRGSEHWRAATEPYEPGSTLKPFLVAALLAEGRATLGDTVYAERGRYVHGGRTIRDVHAYGWLTLHDALQLSSNIAMVKMASRLDPAMQYRYLRDFGFGTRTGVPYPSESGGLLRRPEAWSAYSQASLAIGYEIAATPLQMAMAYGALANGGVLMEPRLVRRITGRDGQPVAGFSPEPVRRVLPEPVASAVAAVLVDVVEEGTGQRAALGELEVAGKTGTTKRFDGVDYEGGGYTASFAGFFPAGDPQLVFLVKLDRPQDSYYGGLVAAPVTRAALEAALAAGSTPLDRRAVVEPWPVTPRRPRDAVAGGTSVAPGAHFAATAWAAGPVDPMGPSQSVSLALDVQNAVPGHRYPLRTVAATHTIPDVRGLPLRDAVRWLHAAGFRVQVEGAGPVRASSPAGGTRAASATVVRVYGSRDVDGAGAAGSHAPPGTAAAEAVTAVRRSAGAG